MPGFGAVVETDAAFAASTPTGVSWACRDAVMVKALLQASMIRYEVRTVFPLVTKYICWYSEQNVAER